MDNAWLALVIGNSRLHWGVFVDTELKQTWDLPHLSYAELPAVGTELPDVKKLLPDYPLPPQPELWVASVVPTQTEYWATYPNAHFLTLEQVPILGSYPTFGIDRAIALWGAVSSQGSPALVIDAGTALTFTGADANQRLVGGAILPGLGLQLQTLNRGTAALPFAQLAHAALPTRWALDTEAAIASGILYTVLAGMESFIQDWWRQFPGSSIILTGGDGDRLWQGVAQLFPELARHLQVDPDLIFKGIRAIKTRCSESTDS